MLHEYPKYFEQFECIGGSCKDSCCIGWELDIDEETYDYYKTLEGEFGDRLRASMREGEDNTFVLKKNGRCPFLNEDNLCDIFINIGEESLCKICTEYPRYSEVVEGYMQSDLNLSCMEAGKLIFSDKAAITYVKNDEAVYSSEKDKVSESLAALLLARDSILGILQIAYKGKITLGNVIHTISKAAGIEHEYYADSQYVKLKKYAKSLARFGYNNRHFNKVVSESIEEKDTREFSFDTVLDNWDEIYEILGEMEILDDVWEQVLEDTNNHMAEISKIRDLEEGKKLISDFENCTKKYEDTDIKVLMYFVFRYMIRAYDDNNIKSKVKFAIFSYCVIKAMDYARWHDNGFAYSLADRIDIAHIYSKEVEHSAENVDYLLEEMLFS